MYLNCSVNCNKRIHSCGHIMWHGWHVSTDICIVPTQKRGCLKAIKDVWRNNTWKKDHKYFHFTVELLFQPVSHSFWPGSWRCEMGDSPFPELGACLQSTPVCILINLPSMKSLIFGCKGDCTLTQAAHVMVHRLTKAPVIALFVYELLLNSMVKVFLLY